MLLTDVKMIKMKRSGNPLMEASSRVIIMDVPEQVTRRRRRRRDVNFLAKIEKNCTKLLVIVDFYFCFYF